MGWVCLVLARLGSAGGSPARRLGTALLPSWAQLQAQRGFLVGMAETQATKPNTVGMTSPPTRPVGPGGPVAPVPGLASLWCQGPFPILSSGVRVNPTGDRGV